jgi:four helix bundle protein
VAATLAEGSARRTTRDYAHFVTIALGSAEEVRYLLTLAARLGFLAEQTATPTEESV